MIGEFQVKHLLIDAKNMLYRAIFAAESDVNFTKSGHHPINVVLHFIHSWNINFKPDQIHIFWDADRKKTWRREICESYKSHRKNKPRLEEAQDKLGDLSPACISLFKEMGFRQYYRSKQEADDLIYAFCRMNLSDEIIIVSSDGDLKQIPYRFRNVKVHNPLSKNRQIEPIPEVDPVIYKALTGDKSDNIEGYYLIGEVKATAMCKDHPALQEFLGSDKAIIKINGEKKIVNEKRFIDNLKIIDLGLCPELMQNMLYIIKTQSKPTSFNLAKIKRIVVKRKLRGVLGEIHRYISPFKKLGENNGSID